MSGDSSIFGKHSPSILNDQFFEFLGFALDFEVWIPNVWNSQKRTHTLVAMLVSDYSELENFKFKLSQIVRQAKLYNCYSTICYSNCDNSIGFLDFMTKRRSRESMTERSVVSDYEKYKSVYTIV